jgi:hypothetical protein
MKLTAAASIAALLGFLAQPAGAAVILTFGQVGDANTITGTASASGTTFGGTDVPVTITQIGAGVATPLSAFLDLSATSTPAGANTTAGVIVEHFAGTFSFNAAADNTGTNYLSGTFADGAITADGATAIAIFGPQANFASDVITTLDLPRSVSFGLTDVTPAVSLAFAPGTDSGLTIGSFAASIAGNASANVAVPEPASLGLLGLGLIGLGLVRCRGRNKLAT